MNAAIKKIFSQYVNMFIDDISTTFDIDKTRLQEMWDETQAKKPARKTARQTRKMKSPTAYILFCQAHREALKEKNMTFSAISKELGNMWRALSDDEKTRYKNEQSRLRQEAEEAQQEEQSRDNDDAIGTASPPPIFQRSVRFQEPVVSAEYRHPETVSPPPHSEEEVEEAAAPKNRRPKIKNKIPDDITSDRDQELWQTFAQLKVKDLRVQCENFGLMTSTKRNDMIRALMIHRKALENGQTSVQDDETMDLNDDFDQEDDF